MSLHNTFNRLRELGFNPNKILDLGCYVGSWTQNASQFFPNAHFTMVDGIFYPQAANLRFPRNIYKNAILNETEGFVDWYEEKNTGDSFFKERTVHFANTQPLRKECTTLDKLCENECFDLIKIDCQGAEIPILKGGKEVASKAEFILLEMPFCGQYNHGVPDFKTHINFMDDLGFVPFDICELHHGFKCLFQIDIMFIRKDSKFLEKIQNGIDGK